MNKTWRRSVLTFLPACSCCAHPAMSMCMCCVLLIMENLWICNSCSGVLWVKPNATFYYNKNPVWMLKISKGLLAIDLYYSLTRLWFSSCADLQDHRLALQVVLHSVDADVVLWPRPEVSQGDWGHRVRQNELSAAALHRGGGDHTVACIQTHSPWSPFNTGGPLTGLECTLQMHLSQIMSYSYQWWEPEVWSRRSQWTSHQHQSLCGR